MTDLGNNLFATTDEDIFIKLSNNFSMQGIKNYINLGSEDFEILGTVTKDNIDFDSHPYCENSIDNHRKYKLYPSGETNFNTVSFRSLLSSKGLFFENPCGKEPSALDYLTDAFETDLKNWQQAQNNLIDKLVIIKKV